MSECHQRYGEVVRYGPNRVIISSETGLHDIYDHSKPVKKSKAYIPLVRVMGGWSILTSIDKQVHRHKRRLMSPWFSDDNMRAFEPSLLSQVRVLCDQLLKDSNENLRDGWTDLKDVKEFCQRFTFDIIGEFAFGRKFGSLETPDNGFVIEAIRLTNMRTGGYVQSPGLPQILMDVIWCPLNRHLRRRCQAWMTCLHKDFNSSIQTGGAGHFATFLSNKFGRGEEVLSAELEAEARFLITAGTETSAIGLASIFFYLTRYPRVYQRLADEIRCKFLDVEQICSGARLASCTYLYACINEAMRMSGPTVGCMWREVEETGIQVDGVYIPAGCDVGSCIYAVHHNEQYYPDAFSYIPERWLKPRAEMERALKAFCPFSFGPRGCAGKSLAMLEMSVVVARVMWLMDFRECQSNLSQSGAGTPPTISGKHREREYQLFSGVTSSSQGPVLQFKQRQI